MMMTSTEKNTIFSDQGIQNITALSSTLKRIHIRLISEGYIIKDGKIYRPVKNLELNAKIDI